MMLTLFCSNEEQHDSDHDQYIPPSCPSSRSNSPSAHARADDDDDEYGSEIEYTSDDHEESDHDEGDEDKLFAQAQAEEKAEEKEFLLQPNNAWCDAPAEDDEETCEYKTFVYQLSETRSRTSQCISHFNQYMKLFSDVGIKIKQKNGINKKVPISLDELFKELGMKSEFGDWKLKKMCIQQCHFFMMTS